jgi:hypothetical protein
VKVVGTARQEEAKSVRMIEPAFGVGWFSARNRALALPASEDQRIAARN